MQVIDKHASVETKAQLFSGLYSTVVWRFVCALAVNIEKIHLHVLGVYDLY